MKKRSLRLLTIMLLYPSLSFSATYYVSATGNDSNPGTQALPWQTLYKVGITNLAPGHQVLFERGGVFPGCLQPATSGTAAKPIVYGAYGSGNKPIIDATQRYAGIVVQRKEYLEFRDLEVRNAKAQGFWFTDGNKNITIDRVRVGNNGLNGIAVSDAGGSITSNYFVIKNTVTDHNTAMGMALGSLANSLIQGNVATYNCQSLTCGDMCTWCGGIRMTNTTSIGNIVENNEASYNTHGVGIWLDFNGPGNIVRYNKTHHNVHGIFNEITSGTEIYGNVSYSNTGMEISAGIYIEGRHEKPPLSGEAVGNKVYNNTIYGNGGFGLMLQNGGWTRGFTHDNIIINNIITGTVSGPNLRVGGGAETEYNLFKHNMLGPEKPNFVEWGWGVYKSTYASWEASYGGDTHSVKIDPQFANSPAGDLSLKPTSAGIDAGVNLGDAYKLGLSANSKWPYQIVTVDRNRCGTAWDIGAYEYTAGGSSTGTRQGRRARVP